jgi:hypothetical protein
MKNNDGTATLMRFSGLILDKILIEFNQGTFYFNRKKNKCKNAQFENILNLNFTILINLYLKLISKISSKTRLILIKKNKSM